MHCCRKMLFLAVAMTILLAAGGQTATAGPAEPWVRGLWPIDEGKGDTLADHSGYGNHGMATRAAWVRSDGKAAMKFSEADKSFVEVAHSPSLDLTGQFTIHLQVKSYGPTGKFQGLIAKRDDSNEREKVQFQLALSHRLELMYTIGVGGQENLWQPHSDIFLKPNRWYDITATYDAFLRQVILVAVPEADTGTAGGKLMLKRLDEAPVIRTSDNPVRLGWTGSADEYLNGELRNVQIVDNLAETIARLKSTGIDHAVLADSTYVPHVYIFDNLAEAIARLKITGNDREAFVFATRHSTAVGGWLMGTVRVKAINPRDKPSRVTLSVEPSEPKIAQDAVVPAAGAVGISLTLFESPGRHQVQLALAEGDVPAGETTINIPGSKDVRGYRGLVVSHTHSDLCWCDTPEVCLTANVEAFAKSVELAETVPGYRFTMEHALYVREYLHRHPDKLQTVKRLLKAGIVETGAFYTGPWELTSGGEGLVRQLYLGKRWLQEHLGFEPVVVWNVDVAGHTAQMPQILHKAGIHALVISAGATDNTYQAPYLLHETRGPFLFRWQAPDGSTIMTWSTPWGYSAGSAMGLRNDTLDALASTLPTFLDDIRRNCTAHKLPPIAFITDGTDVEKPSARVGEKIARWNAEKRFPPLEYVSSTELFRAVENEPLPTYAGELPSYWDVLQSLGQECLMADRRLDGRLLAAEKFATFASLVSPGFAYPRQQLEQVWEDRLYVVEHNWGGSNGEISDRVKTEKTRAACAINDAVLNSAMGSLAAAIGFRRADAVPVVVFNPLLWDREDIVTCTLNIAGNNAPRLRLYDSSGAPVAAQVVRRDAGVPAGQSQVAFCAKVPSLGYATYYAVLESGEDTARAAEKSPFQVEAEENRFQNDFYRLTLDPRTGGIKSLFDKRGQKELVRQDSKYACNELMAKEDDEVDNKCHFTGKEWMMRQQPSSIKVVEQGPVRLVVEVTGRVVDDSTRRQEIILYRDLPRVDLVTTLDWHGKKNVHVYQTFPLNLANPTVRYAVPYGWEELGKEMKYAAPWPFGPVAGYPWRGMRGWAEAAQGDCRVTLASECNMAAFRDLGPKPEAGCLIAPLLLRTVRSSGDDNLYYSQRGEHSFRFALQAGADSVRLGEELNTPLMPLLFLGVPVRPGSMPERFSFARVGSDHVQLAVVKAAEDGRGVILRLAETAKSKDQTPVAVEFFRPISKATRTSIIEYDEAALPAPAGKLSLPFGPASIETVRVEFGGGGQ